MNLKNFLLIITFIFIPYSLNAQFDFPDLSDEDLQALQQDVAAIDEFIKSLPPEEQRKIEEEAFRILSEMPEEDLEQFMKLSEQITENMQPTDELPIQETPEKIESQESKKDLRVIEQERQKKVELRATITAIIDFLDSLISKTQSMPRISDRPDVEKRWINQSRAIDTFRSLLEHITNPVSVDKDILISKLILDDHADFRSKLNQIKLSLQRVIPSIKLPDQMGLKKADPHALRNLNQIISDIENLDLEPLSQKTRELIEKYAPKELEKEKKNNASNPRSKETSYTRDDSMAYDQYSPSQRYGNRYPYEYDNVMAPPSHRTTDAGRYIQKAPNQKNTNNHTLPFGDQNPKKGSQPINRSPKNQPSHPGSIPTNPKTPSRSTKPSHSNQDLEKKAQDFKAAFEEMQKELMAPINDNKDLTILSVGQYLMLEESPLNKKMHDSIKDSLISASRKISTAAKRLKELFTISKKLNPQGFQAEERLFKKNFMKGDQYALLESLSNISLDTIAASKQSLKKDFERLQKAWKKLTEAVGIKESSNKNK
jgi:hypothetical protein